MRFKEYRNYLVNLLVRLIRPKLNKKEAFSIQHLLSTATKPLAFPSTHLTH